MNYSSTLYGYTNYTYTIYCYNTLSFQVIRYQRFVPAPHVLSRCTKYMLASVADALSFAPLASHPDAQGLGYFGDA